MENTSERLVYTRRMTGKMTNTGIMKNWIIMLFVAAASLLYTGQVNAQCAPGTPEQDAQIRFANEQVDCANNKLYVDVQLANPTAAPYSVSSLSMRFTFNNSMLANPVIFTETFSGTHSLALQSSVWSYGLVEFSSVNILPSSGSWTTVGTLEFDVLNYNAGGNVNCVDLTWNEATDFPPTTGQQFVSFICQPNLNYTSYGSSIICIADSCASSPLDIQVTPTDVGCGSSNNGAIDIAVTGGSTPYTYAWSNSATTEDLSGLTTGTYSVTVTDNSGATAAATGIVISSSANLQLTATVMNADCFNSGDGEIDLTAASGVTPYTYAWSNGEITEDVSGLLAGTYTVTVTDANGCTGTDDYTITEPGEFVYNVTIKNVSCNGGADASLDFTPGGGVPPYTYEWKDPFTAAVIANTQDLTAIGAGIYQLDLTDGNGCLGRVFYLISEPNGIEIDGIATSITQVQCFGDSSGAINLTARGGTGVLSYVWSNGETSQDLDNEPAGMYIVTVTDLNMCSLVDTFEITQPDAIEVTFTPNGVQNVSCNGGNDGSIDISVSGGSNPFTYNWSNGATTEDITGLTAGTYTLEVEDIIGCLSGDVTFTITEPAALSINPTITDISCSGTFDDGAVSTAVAGGTSPYTYTWSNSATTSGISGLAMGTYTITVTDANNCTTQGSYMFTDPTCNNPPLARNDINNTLQGTPVGGNVLTNDRDPDGDDIVVTSIPTPLTGPSNGTVSIGSDGTYLYTPNGSFIGTDNFTYVICDDGTPSLCDTATVTIEVYPREDNDDNNPPVANDDDFITYEGQSITSTVISNDFDPDTSDIITVTATISGPSNGTLTLNPNGSFTYTPNGGFTGDDTFVYQLCDNGSPQLCDTATVTIHVLGDSDPNNNPPVAVDDAVATLYNTPVDGNILTNDYDPDGDNISINVAPLGGPTNGTVSVNPDGSFTYIPNNNYVGPDQFTYVICDDGVPSACDTATAYITVLPYDPCATADITDLLCNGDNTGAIDVTVTCGVAPFTFAWNTGATSEDLNGLAAGTYTVTVTGAFGNTTVLDGLVVGEPDAVVATVTTTSDATCNGLTDGSIDVTVSGGTPAYTYAWSNGATTEDLSAIVAGTYNVTVTDANGCTATINGITIGEPSVLTAVVTTTSDATCDGLTDGSIDITVSGGTPAYTYAWSTGATTEDLSAVGAGTYNVTVTDANGCTATINGITIGEPNVLTAVVTTASDATCNGLTDGSIDVTISGGTPAYTYAWSNGATTEDLSAVVAGTYDVTVTDANGCTATINGITVGQPDVLAVAVTSTTDVLCNSETDGAIDITVSGGTPAYTYAWSNGAVTEDLSGIVAGTYAVTVTDANGCTGTATNIAINEPPAFVTGATVTDASCNGGADGEIDITISGGTPAYTFAWSNAETTEDITGLIAGTYTVTITDANGCSETVTETVSEASSLSVSGTETNIACFGDSVGSIDVSVTGGTPAYTFAWSNGATTEDLTNVPTGTYGLTVTDVNNCNDVSSYTITSPDSIEVALQEVVDVSCFGAGDGQITLAVTGGVSPYTYDWSSGVAGITQGNLNSGVFVITVTDANGCTAVSNSVIINEPDSLILTGVVTDAGCNGDTTGSIDVTVGGGIPNYFYNWSNGSSDQDISGLTAGSYTVTMTDANSCTKTEVFVVGEPDAIVISIDSITHAACNGATNGGIDISVAGGTPGYTFAWSTGATTEDISGIAAGTYDVTVTDANGCTGVLNAITVAEADMLMATINTVTDASCNGGTDGAIDIDVTGGTPAYTYAWNTADVTQDIAGVAAGTYTVTVTDVNGCSTTLTATVGQTDAIVVTVDSVTDAACFGQASGAIDISVTGGTPNYTYNWDSGNTTQDLSGVAAGTYNVTVTDANGCTGVANGVTVGQANPIAVTVDSTSNASCNLADDGSISISVTGGTPGYTYAWSNFGTTQDITGIPAGTYAVTVTDVNGCTGTASGINITEPNPLDAMMTGMTRPGCFGDTTGSLDITVTGGTPAYSYLWSNGATTEDLTNIAAGAYDVTVTDANGCTDVLAGITLGQPTQLAATVSITDATCNGAADGAVDLTVTGGTTGYTFAWGNGATTEDLSNLNPGTYAVTVTDANGCTTAASGTVGEPNGIEIDFDITNAVCEDDANGGVDATITGGTAPYTYTWSDGSSAQNLSNATAGLYSLMVTDANGCVAMATATIGTDVILEINTGVVNATCGDANGSISLNVSGGNGTYNYTWSGGLSGASPTGLAAGTYTVTVEDVLTGCTKTINVPVSNISDITITGTVTDATCGSPNAGAIDITVTGGSGMITYAWSNSAATEDISGLAAGTYDVTVTDATGCAEVATFTIASQSDVTLNLTAQPSACGQSTGIATAGVISGTAPYSYHWNTDDTTQQIIGLDPGVYMVTVTDANGCTAMAMATVSSVSGPTVSLFPSDLTCASSADGEITSAVSGSGPYIFLWSNGDTTAGLSNLVAGTYGVTVTDINGCQGTAVTTIDRVDAIQVVADKVDVACNGSNSGSIDLTTTGGTPGYTYAWSNSASTEDLNNLVAGTFDVVVTDANGCAASLSINIGEPNALDATIVATTDVSCSGANNGAIDAEVTGGTMPYTYSWNTGDTTQDLNGIAGGTYTLITTDANGCADTVTATVNDAQLLSINVTAITQISCFGECDGAIDVSVNGGTAPFTYAWSNGAVTEDVDSLCDGAYTVTVTDANGCSNTSSAISIDEPAEIVAVPDVTNVTCPGDSDGSIDVSLGGGIAPFTFDWNNGQTGLPLTGLPAGIYTATITDANGCTTTVTGNVPGVEDFGFSNSTVTDATCDTLSDGAINAIVSGGTGPFQFTWVKDGSALPNNLGSFIDGLGIGTYNLTVTDANGCEGDTSFLVGGPQCNQPLECVPDTARTFQVTPVDIEVLVNDTDPDGDIIFITGITTDPTNGVADINSDGTITYIPNEDFVGVDSFYYSVSDGSDECVALVIVYVLPDEPNIFIPNGFSPNGDGVNDEFEITDIESYPQNDLIIFNRWGNKIWEAKGYLNEWRGTNMDNEDLPDGTYYYILNLGDENKTQYAGFVVIHRAQ